MYIYKSSALSHLSSLSKYIYYFLFSASTDKDHKMATEFDTAYNNILRELVPKVRERLNRGEKVFLDIEHVQTLVHQRITKGTASKPGVAMVLDAEFLSCIIDLSQSNIPAVASGLNEVVKAGTVAVVLPEDGAPSGKFFAEGVMLKQSAPQMGAKGTNPRVFTYDKQLANLFLKE
jgi:hypothetical protein